jgi:hypothetical protein
VPNPPARPPLGEFWIRAAFAEDQDSYPVCDGIMGPTLPVPQQGYGGWQEQERRRRRTALRWDGSPPVVIPLDILFGGRLIKTRRTVSCESQIRAAEKMAGLSHDGTEPPVVQWAANAPHDYTHAPQNLWVIDDLQWSAERGDYFVMDDGDRSQARAIAMMKLWTPTELFRAHPAKLSRDKASGQKGKQPKKKNHRVQPGESLSSIAAKYLGSAAKYTVLAKLNNLRDPDDVKVGQVIKLR